MTDGCYHMKRIPLKDGLGMIEGSVDINSLL